MLVKISIRMLNQHAGTVRVEYKGRTHTGRWNNEGDIYNEGELSNVNLLKAAVVSWGKGEQPVKDDFELQDTELADLSDGWWDPSLTPV